MVVVLQLRLFPSQKAGTSNIRCDHTTAKPPQFFLLPHSCIARISFVCVRHRCHITLALVSSGALLSSAHVHTSRFALPPTRAQATQRPTKADLSSSPTSYSFARPPQYTAAAAMAAREGTKEERQPLRSGADVKPVYCVPARSGSIGSANEVRREGGGGWEGGRGEDSPTHHIHTTLNLSPNHAQARLNGNDMPTISSSSPGSGTYGTWVGGGCIRRAIESRGICCCTSCCQSVAPASPFLPPSI